MWELWGFLFSSLGLQRESFRGDSGLDNFFMESSRSRRPRQPGSREPFDRRVDKWIETGRQVVDGVAGGRPGARRISSSGLSRSGLDKVGRWVGDKLDWFLEDEDGWFEPWESRSQSSPSSSGKKRPLDAISKRVSSSLRTSVDSSPEGNEGRDEWPDESAFRIERWKRRDQTQPTDAESLPANDSGPIPLTRRPLPRSSRRR